jgi:hypothetical protein
MRSKYVVREAHAAAPLQGPQLVRWGSVFSGTIIAIAVFALLNALWLALSFGSHVSAVYSNLSWWVGGTAIFCMFVAGLIAGLTSGARGVGAGSVGGLTTWGLIVIGVGVVLLPTFAIGHVPNTVTAGGRLYSINYLTYWTAFWSLVIGLGGSVIGGMAGGALQRRVDEPYLDLHRLETHVAQTPVTSAPVAAVPARDAAAFNVPVTTPTGPLGNRATGTVPVVYERQA